MDFLVNNQRILAVHENTIRALALLKNGDLVSGSDDRKIKIWDRRGLSLKNTINDGGYVHSLTVLMNGDLASGSNKKFKNMG